MRRRGLGIATALLAILGLTASAEADNGPSGIDAIVETFIELTMRSEHGPQSPGRYLVLTKWEKPLTWTLLGDAPADVSRDIAAILQRASVLTAGKVRASYVEPSVVRPFGTPFASADVPIRDATGAHVGLHLDGNFDERPIIATYSSRSRIVSAVANVVVLYGDRPFLAKIARVLPGQPKSLGEDIEKGRANCVAYTWTAAKSNDIAHTLIVVADNLKPEVRSGCLWEELGQILGVRNDLADASFSIFTNRLAGKPSQWTAFDENVIRMLYDPSFKVGMSFEQVKGTAKGLVPRYFADSVK